MLLNLVEEVGAASSIVDVARVGECVPGAARFPDFGGDRAVASLDSQTSYRDVLVYVEYVVECGVGGGVGKWIGSKGEA